MDRDQSNPLESTDLSTPASADKPRNWSLIARSVAATLAAAAFLAFMFQNTDSIEVNFLSWSFDLATSLVMVLSAVIGVVIWQLAGVISRRASRN